MAKVMPVVVLLARPSMGTYTSKWAVVSLMSDCFFHASGGSCITASTQCEDLGDTVGVIAEFNLVVASISSAA